MKKLLSLIIICIIVYLFLFLFYLLYLFITNIYILDEKNFLIHNGIIFLSVLYYIYGSGSPQHKNIIEALDTNKLWFYNHVYNLTHSNLNLEERRLKSKFFRYIKGEFIGELLLIYYELRNHAEIYLRKKRVRLERIIRDIVAYKVPNFYNKTIWFYNLLDRNFCIYYKRVIHISKRWYLMFRRIIIYMICIPKRVYLALRRVIKYIMFYYNLYIDWCVVTGTTLEHLHARIENALIRKKHKFQKKLYRCFITCLKFIIRYFIMCLKFIILYFIICLKFIIRCSIPCLKRIINIFRGKT